MASKAGGQVSCSSLLKDENKISHHKISVLTNLRSCDDQCASLEILIENNLKEVANLMQKKKRLEESKVRLCEQQPQLQERLQQVIEDINRSESECFSFRKKLPYLSRRAIVDNISLLEQQLRLHNYRPREEELMLREISKLRNSLPVLEEYRTSVQLNRQLRNDRVKLVSQRNDCYDKLQALLPKIQALCDQLSNVQQTLQENRRGLEQVKQHKVHLLEVARKQLEKKRRRQQETHQLKHRGQTLLAGATEVPLAHTRVVPVVRDVYGAELAACRRLLQYCQSLCPVADVLCGGVTPSPVSAPGPATGGNNRAASRDLEEPSQVAPTGTFYSKPKDGMEQSCGQRVLHQNSLHKKKKARNRAKKDLRHPPDVVGHFLDLGLGVPKSALDIPALIIDIQEKFNYFQMLNEQLYFDTVEAIHAQDATAHIIHVTFQTGNLSENGNTHSKPCSNDSRKKTESVDARACSPGFVCHRTHNIFESDAGVEVMIGSSPPKLYSDIAKLPLTSVVGRSSSSVKSSLEETLKLPARVSEALSPALTTVTPVSSEETLSREARTSAEGACSAEKEETSDAHGRENIPCVSGGSSESLTQRSTDLHCKNIAGIVSVLEEKSTSKVSNDLSGMNCHHMQDGISLELAKHHLVPAEPSSCDDEDCESGVYEADCAQKIELMHITDNSNLMLKAFCESESSLLPSTVESDRGNVQNTCDAASNKCDVGPDIVVECVSECSAEVSIVMDPSCSSDSSSSSGCSCAGSSSASSTKGVTLHDRQETTFLTVEKPATLLAKSSSVACHPESGPNSGFREKVKEFNKINFAGNILCPTSLPPSPSSTESNPNVAHYITSSLKSPDEPCSTTRLPTTSKKNLSIDEKNDNNDLSAVRGGFCALSPRQTAAMAVAEAGAIVSYAAVAKQK
ncbi:hypothetical protein FHG87_002427 [Trinorchestia longiramus]|nr:hypothetical protein FHG87_002427 [Trinorchestia longiramus]